jgi:putative ABC transport system ATP-binding protein
MSGVIGVHGLVQRHGSAEALRLADWKVSQGERWLVLGPSGCGKTTLLHVLAGLLRPSEGEVEVAGAALHKLDGSRLDRWRGATVGVVLQALHLVSHLGVRDNLRLAQYMARLPADEARIDEALDALGIADKSRRRPAELSQGEQQRVAIARAVVNRPRLLLADEPTASLDDRAAAAVVELLSQQAARYGATLVVATHDARVKATFHQRLELALA